MQTFLLIPLSGSPVEIGDALVTSGFDIVEQANNHVFDKGITGITDTIRYWKPVTRKLLSRYP